MHLGLCAQHNAQRQHRCAAACGSSCSCHSCVRCLQPAGLQINVACAGLVCSYGDADSGVCVFSGKAGRCVLDWRLRCFMVVNQRFADPVWCCAPLSTPMCCRCTSTVVCRFEHVMRLRAFRQGCVSAVLFRLPFVASGMRGFRSLFTSAAHPTCNCGLVRDNSCAVDKKWDACSEGLTYQHV